MTEVDDDTLALACQALRLGKVIAYPTEAVWGFGCDPDNEQAVTRILTLKQRAVEKGLILVASSPGEIKPLLDNLSASQRQQLDATWPGPVTWLIPDQAQLYPNWIKGEHQSVAIRLSDHPVVRALCRGFGGPIVSTSANRAGQPEIRSRLKLEQEFASSIDYIVPGDLGNATAPSTIRDLVTGQVIR
jgi:L-threonylcarbamoyladenylate synthase